MLVVWNHLQGWRFQLADDHQFENKGSVGKGNEILTGLPQRSTGAATLGGFRAISSDDGFKSLLYNKDVEDAVGRNI
jgi:hypothetical protein